MGRSDLKKLLEQKKKAKEQMFSKYWPKRNIREPLLIVFEPQQTLYQEAFLELLKGVSVLPMQVIVVSSHEKMQVQGGEGTIIWYNTLSESTQKLENYLLASDLAVVFGEHDDLINKLFQKAVIPVGQDTSALLENYHPNEETGNSFTYKTVNPWDIFSSLVRANETYRFPYDWQFILRGILHVR